MSVDNPSFGTIPRQSVVGMEGMFVKMWDPPTSSPETADVVAPTNPVPEVMAAAGYQNLPSTPHTVMRDLLHGARLTAWDGKELNFMLLRDHDNPATGDGNYPGATIRVPRGAIFHCETSGHGPPPHTIHWHGIEPTPMNDGVGHCSMEVGNYTYQWQANFMGFYFAHCHRNTVQHFEFGLYMAVIVDAPDAFFATQWNRAIPIGAGRDGKRRCAANLNRIGTTSGVVNAGSGAGFETITIRSDAEVQALWPGYVGGPIEAPDTEAANYPGFPVTFQSNPHAFTVPIDVEALWVVDDRDSRWSDLAPNARATYPRHGNHPGIDDEFDRNPGADGFFAFNDFNPDYWYVTGVNFPSDNPSLPAGTPGAVGTIPSDIVIPPQLMSGVSGVQVPINAKVGQNILVRVLDGAYNNATYRFPVDITIIAWDGRGLGATSQTQFNHAYTVPANTPIHVSVARRFDALIKSDVPVSGFATVEFTETRCGTAAGFERPVLFTGRIPINIAANPQIGTFSISGTANAGTALTLIGPGNNDTVVAGPNGSYTFPGLANGDYVITPSLAGFTFAPRSLSVTINGADVTGQNFTGTATTGSFSISGNINFRGVAIRGVTVTARGPAVQTVVTDAQGNYTLTGLPNGTYSVTPFFGGFRFDPSLRGVTVNGANVAGRNFRAIIV